MNSRSLAENVRAYRDRKSKATGAHPQFKPWKGDQLLHTMRQAARTYLLERSHEQLLEDYRRLNLELEQRVRQRTQELEAAHARIPGPRGSRCAGRSGPPCVRSAPRRAADALRPP